MNKAFVREPETTEVFCPACGAAGEVTLRAAFEASVLASSLLTPVWPKDPAAPLCPCFQMTLDDVKADVADTTPRRIRELLAKSKTPAARCEELSPTGRCCIPEVQRWYFKLRS